MILIPALICLLSSCEKWDGNATFYDPSNSGMPDDFVVWDIKTDNHDNIWLGGDGLLKFDGTNFTLFNSANSAIPEDFVKSINIDSKDNIWFTSCRFRQGGIVRYDGSQFTVFTVAEAPDRRIWIGTGDGVFIFLYGCMAGRNLMPITETRLFPWAS